MFSLYQELNATKTYDLFLNLLFFQALPPWLLPMYAKQLENGLYVIYRYYTDNRSQHTVYLRTIMAWALCAGR